MFPPRGPRPEEGRDEAGGISLLCKVNRHVSEPDLTGGDPEPRPVVPHRGGAWTPLEGAPQRPTPGLATARIKIYNIVWTVVRDRPTLDDYRHQVELSPMPGKLFVFADLQAPSNDYMHAVNHYLDTTVRQGRLGKNSGEVGIRGG